jgi:hypothetical protein
LLVIAVPTCGRERPVEFARTASLSQGILNSSEGQKRDPEDLMMRKRVAPSPDDASHRLENHVPHVILRDPRRRALQDGACCAAMRKLPVVPICRSRRH